MSINFPVKYWEKAHKNPASNRFSITRETHSKSVWYLWDVGWESGCGGSLTYVEHMIKQHERMQLCSLCQIADAVMILAGVGSGCSLVG